MRKVLLGLVVLSSLSVFTATDAEAGWRCRRMSRPSSRQPLRCRRDRAKPDQAKPAPRNIKQEVDFLRDRVGELEEDIEKLKKDVDELK